MMTARIEAVAIGASAGGVQALQRLVGQLPAKFAPALVIVLHLAPQRPSGLVRLLAPRCALPVSEALDKQPLMPGSVIIAPPDYHLLVERDRSLALSVDEPVNYSRPAIDPLFETAAIAFRDSLLAIVLTGANADGSKGLAAVRAHGGAAWVQEPSTAAAATMPQSALEYAGADLVLTLEQIGDRLAALTNR